MKQSITSGLIWKLMERFSVQGIQFILQIVLARLLMPEDYGMLSIMIIFTTLANVFIQTGFSTALIQNKDVTDEDYSSVFWVTLIIAIVLYFVIFFSAPMISKFFKMEDIVLPMRILALILLPGALNSILLARISREMEFRKVFYSNIGGICIAGPIGIIVAFLGGGVWALVIQNVSHVILVCIIMSNASSLKLKVYCNIRRVRVLFSFGWKLLVSSLMETVYLNLSNLIIGKIYNPSTLGYFNRGMQFPQYLMDSINNSVQSVMLPAMSAEQEDIEKVKHIMRTSIRGIAYTVFPMMAGLAAVSESVIIIFLTDKWLPCAPFMQIYCIVFAFYPINASNLQAINAMGRSDIYLKLEIIKKAFGVLFLAVAVLCFDTPIAIAVAACISTWLGWAVNAAPNRKLIGYSYREQMCDLLPSAVMSLIMFAIVFFVGRFQLGAMALLILQVIIGVIVYLVISLLVKPEPFIVLKKKIYNSISSKVKK